VGKRCRTDCLDVPNLRAEDALAEPPGSRQLFQGLFLLRQTAGLRSAVEMLGLEFGGVPHGALVDARNAARVHAAVIRRMRRQPHQLAKVQFLLHLMIGCTGPLGRSMDESHRHSAPMAKKPRLIMKRRCLQGDQAAIDKILALNPSITRLVGTDPVDGGCGEKELPPALSGMLRGQFHVRFKDSGRCRRREARPRKLLR